MKRSEKAFKIYMMMASVGFAASLIGSIVIHKMEKSDVPTPQAKMQIESEALKFSENHSINDCISEVQTKTKSCLRDDLSCMVSSKIFLKACLSGPVYAGGFCDGFQIGNEPAKAESFSSVFCNSHQEIDIVVCRNTFDAVEQYCQKKLSLK